MHGCGVGGRVEEEGRTEPTISLSNTYEVAEMRNRHWVYYLTLQI